MYPASRLGLSFYSLVVAADLGILRLVVRASFEVLATSIISESSFLIKGTVACRPLRALSALDARSLLDSHGAFNP